MGASVDAPCGSNEPDDGGPGALETPGPAGIAGASGSGACASPELECDGRCVDASSDAAHCGRCLNACMSGVACVAGACVAEGSLPGGSVNEGNIDPVLTPPSLPGETPGGTPGSCQAGSSSTTWAATCQTELATTCTPGQFQSWGSSAPENYPLRYETEHFAFLWPDERDVSMAWRACCLRDRTGAPERRRLRPGEPANTPSATIDDVTIAPPYAWRD